MQTNNHKIVDYDIILDKKFGKEGTPERAQAEENASKKCQSHTGGIGKAHKYNKVLYLQDREWCYNTKCRRIL